MVISTQGVPTDSNGHNKSEAMKEFIGSLFVLSELPVKITFRLCTREKKVLEFYNKVDLDIPCDVLGDYWTEVSILTECQILHFMNNVKPSPA